jgi:MFS family permease
MEGSRRSSSSCYLLALFLLLLLLLLLLILLLLLLLQVSWRQLLTVPGIPVTCFALCLAGTSWSWYQASLQPFLAAKFGFSSASTGLVFTAFGLTYTLATPLFGWLSDRGLVSGLPALGLGNLTIALGFLLLGPVPFLQPLLGSHAWLTVLSIAVQGVGCSATYICSQVKGGTSWPQVGF